MFDSAYNIISVEVGRPAIMLAINKETGMKKTKLKKNEIKIKKKKKLKQNIKKIPFKDHTSKKKLKTKLSKKRFVLGIRYS